METPSTPSCRARSSAPSARPSSPKPARRMGVMSTTCLTYPDGGLAGVAEDRVVRDIVRWVRQVRPDVVITWGPDGGYGHPDHIAAGERALVALELAAIERHELGLGAAHR